ncbi:unnamed protein product [Paramecium sonneborni]|uniref:Uncharacterized protein n=1 Tax=Paramecium sonneborni TaxID=65129 RepID=A0A8S1RM84_9CILI|nr:unnamed protein product [Paramecium sonneborni]
MRVELDNQRDKLILFLEIQHVNKQEVKERDVTILIKDLFIRILDLDYKQLECAMVQMMG